MNESSSEHINDCELKFSREQGFFDTNKTLTFFVGLAFAVSLFFMLHFREIHVEVLELGTIAPRYLVSQVDFDFADEEATIILKQDAVRDIGKIYQLDDKEIRLQRDNFLIYHQDWRKNITPNTFEEIYRGGDLLEKALYSLRFTDPRTLQKLIEVNIPVDHYAIYTPLNVDKEVVLPPHIWNSLKKKIFSSTDFSAESVDFIIDWFQSKQWHLLENIPTETLLSKKLKAKIPDKYTHVSAGNRIIDLGEKVTMRHVAMLQAMQQELREQRNLWHPLTLIGTLILVLILVGICISYFALNHPGVLHSNRKLLLLVTIIIFTFAISKGTEFFLILSKSNLIDFVRYPVFVPFVAIVLCSLMSSSIATFASGFLTIIFTIALAFERQGFMIINLSAAFVALLTTRSLRHRKEVFVVCGKSWLCCVALIFALNFYQDVLWNVHILADIICAGVSLLITAVLVVGLLPLLESTFRVMTDVTVMEFMDPNNELLRRLAIEAPGTYQHSIVVGNLAESAALSIGANGLFCRVASLYHDVGKIVTPHYFTENQGELNIHQLLTPRESAQTIMAHVSEGIMLARKAGLPEQFIDIIKEHHGTTLVYYFYRKELDACGGDKSLVNEAEFRYSGLKPLSKESAIIMIADSVEAASRSLEHPDEQSFMELISRLVREKAEDGQFDNCFLTFEELAIVKESLVKTLVAYGHSRIKYPSRK